MTQNEIYKCITKGNELTTSQLYQDLEQLDIMLSFGYRHLTSQEHNLVMATRLF